MKARADAVVIGGGPAGTSAAIWLAEAGWRVVLAEQHAFPRQKVCGECLPAGAFALLDELGVGELVRQLAGPELRRVGWMDCERTLVADMPACAAMPEPYGRALGRDLFDGLLMDRARAVGVDVRQPAKVTEVRGIPGDYSCELVESAGHGLGHGNARPAVTVGAAVVIDAHGSWERGPRFSVSGSPGDPADKPARSTDLFAFKTTFRRSTLAPGLLPVFAVPGGYGGMVVSNDDRTTVALCLRRDALRAVRSRHRGVTAGSAVERHLRDSCQGVDDALRDAERQTAWLAVGPLRPGSRHAQTPGIFRVGNACGEAHPLVGEGMSMALQSSRALVRMLVDDPGVASRAYNRSWRTAFNPRLRFAACYAHIAMRPALSAPVGEVLRHWPGLLTAAAVLAGKARPAIHAFGPGKEPA
ncbi:MAG: FAD-dependent oxidoreductase [Steroidobacteraceae bacterium]